MSALVRTAIGRFLVDEAVDPRELTRDTWLGFLQPPLRAVDMLQRVQLSAVEATRIRNGLTIVRRGEAEPVATSAGAKAVPDEVAALDPAGQLIGILGPMGADQWRTLRNLPTN